MIDSAAEGAEVCAKTAVSGVTSETCARPADIVLTEGARTRCWIILEWKFNPGGSILRKCLILTAEKRSWARTVKEAAEPYSGPASDPGPGTKHMGRPSRQERAMDKGAEIHALLPEYGRWKRQEVARSGISKPMLLMALFHEEIRDRRADGGSTGMK